ncbi:MAG TPA: ABC transporter permease [Desulfobacterales bacterium]|nr:ABC transporter permease [Desulfobacterales bacterium]
MNISTLNKPAAFLIRDLQIALSYKLQFLLQFVGIFFSSMVFFFVSKLIGGGISDQLAPWGGDYFSFVIIGVALTDYLSVSLEGFSNEIRSAQVEGTLETLLITPTPVSTILFSSTLYSYSVTSLRVIVYIVLGALLFGLNLHMTSILSFIVVMILTVASFAGIGLISAAFIIVFKQGSPINLAVTTGSGLLGGVFYPIDILPSWLEPVSWFLPITHALEAMRQILINGASFSMIYNKVLILALFSALLLPIGLATFQYGLRIAKKEGSLIHY